MPQTLQWLIVFSEVSTGLAITCYLLPHHQLEPLPRGGIVFELSSQHRLMVTFEVAGLAGVIEDNLL